MNGNQQQGRPRLSYWTRGRARARVRGNEEGWGRTCAWVCRMVNWCGDSAVVNEGCTIPLHIATSLQPQKTEASDTSHDDMMVNQPLTSCLMVTKPARGCLKDERKTQTRRQGFWSVNGGTHREQTWLPRVGGPMGVMGVIRPHDDSSRLEIGVLLARVDELDSDSKPKQCLRRIPKNNEQHDFTSTRTKANATCANTTNGQKRKQQKQMCTLKRVEAF